MSDKTKVIICDCYCHALHVDFDAEYDELCLSMWYRSPGNVKMALSQRLRWIWRILTTGHPFTDSIILDAPKGQEMRDFLNQIYPQVKDTVKSADSNKL